MRIDLTRYARTRHEQSANFCPAKLLQPKQRQGIGVEALAGTQSITQLAEVHAVSRKFVYQQAHKAEQALDDNFCQGLNPSGNDSHLPGTEAEQNGKNKNRQP